MGSLLVFLLVVQFSVIHGVMRGEVLYLRLNGATAALTLFTRALEHGLPDADRFVSGWPPGPNFAAYDAQGKALLRMPDTPERLPEAMRKQVRVGGTPVRVAESWALAERHVGQVRYVLLDDSHLVGRLRMSRRRVVALYTLVLVAVGLVLTWTMTRRFRRRLQHVQSVVTRMADGDLDVRLRPPTYDMEVHALATDFNRMADRLAEHISELNAEGERRRRIFADWTHEISTPLTSVLGYLESLRDGGVPEERRQRYLDTAYQQARSLQALAADLGVLSRLESEGLSLDSTPQDVSGVLRSELEAAADSSGEIRVQDEGLVPAHCDADPQRLAQVFRNLLRNAVQHARQRVAVGCEVDDNHCRFLIRDDGEGIEAQHLERVTESFYRADPSRDRGTGGRGLGLAIALRIVEAHGGTLQLSSTPQVGTVVTVQLPRCDPTDPTL